VPTRRCRRWCGRRLPTARRTKNRERLAVAAQERELLARGGVARLSLRHHRQPTNAAPPRAKRASEEGSGTARNSSASRSVTGLPVNVITSSDPSAVKVPTANCPTPPTCPVALAFSATLFPAVAVVKTPESASEDSLVHHSNSYDWPAVKPLMAMVNGTPPAKCERSA